LIHFAVDLVFGLPLLLIPEEILIQMGWQMVDPLSSRLVGAALLAIGGESLLSRNASREVYQALLSLKVIWASTALVAIFLSILQGAPDLAWLFVFIFAGFLAVWVYYKYRIDN
jgi:uncharacterized membrane protein